MEADDDPILAVGIEAVLLAFIACENHIGVSCSNDERYKRQKEKALDLLHWAFDESDLGKELIKVKAQLALQSRKDGGTFYIP